MIGWLSPLNSAPASQAELDSAREEVGRFLPATEEWIPATWEDDWAVVKYNSLWSDVGYIYNEVAKL